MRAYYNENDHFAAEWLRQLIKAGHIAPGDVDERSIEDVYPGDVKNYTQCHFFAGIGVWSYALRRAGWPDERPVWTGSCPCQPFSAAGKGKGFADERHLWPAFFHLIWHRRPVKVFGEQVASKDGLAWIDLVYSDLEGAGYAVGAVDSCAAGFGAPQLRQRVYWVADSDEYGCNKRRECITTARDDGTIGNRPIIGMADAASRRKSAGAWERGQAEGSQEQDRRYGSARISGPVNGHWANADYLFCRDGKWRAVEPGTFPLAHGAANRVGRLRGYGNAIVAPQATEFIKAFMEVV